MKIRPPLLTLATIVVALASFALLVAAPPKTVGTQTPATTHFGDLQGLLTEIES